MKSSREYLHTYHRLKENRLLTALSCQSLDPQATSHSKVTAAHNESHVKVFHGGERLCVCGEEEDEMVERTVIPSLEQHNIDHVYYFQVWQHPNPRNFLLNSPTTWQLKENPQEIMERLKSCHTVTFKVLFNKESRKGKSHPKGGQILNYLFFFFPPLWIYHILLQLVWSTVPFEQ